MLTFICIMNLTFRQIDLTKSHKKDKKRKRSTKSEDRDIYEEGFEYDDGSDSGHEGKRCVFVSVYVCTESLANTGCR